MIMDLLKNEGVFIVWAVLLLAALFILFRYGTRRTETRTVPILLGMLIFLISVGQFAFFYFYYIPRIRTEVHREMDLLIESMSIIELDNVKQNDLALAYQRENEALNRTVRNLRVRNEAMERQAGMTAGAPGETGGTADRVPGPSSVRAPDRDGPKTAVASAEKPAPPAGAAEEPPPARKRKRYRPLRDNTAYNVTILTPEDNRAFAKHLKEAFKWLRFGAKEPRLEDVSETRLVFYSEVDREKADYIAAFLRFTYKFSVQPRLSADPARQGNFELYLTPDSGQYWEERIRKRRP